MLDTVVLFLNNYEAILNGEAIIGLVHVDWLTSVVAANVSQRVVK